jgi:hypothetical protein
VTTKDLLAKSTDLHHQDAPLQAGGIEKLSFAQDANNKVDLVVALQACGSMSDEAVVLAVRHQAGFLVCPCCYLAYSSLPVEPLSSGFSQSVRVDDHPSTGEDVNTANSSANNNSNCSNGCIVSPASWLGLDPPVLSTLQYWAEQEGCSETDDINPTPMSSPNARHILAAVRAEAAQRHWANRWSTDSGSSVDAYHGQHHHHEQDSKKGGEPSKAGGTAGEGCSRNGGSELQVTIQQLPGDARSTRHLCIAGVPKL